MYETTIQLNIRLLFFSYFNFGKYLFSALLPHIFKCVHFAAIILLWRTFLTLICFLSSAACGRVSDRMQFSLMFFAPAFCFISIVLAASAEQLGDGSMMSKYHDFLIPSPNLNLIHLINFNFKFLRAIKICKIFPLNITAGVKFCRFKNNQHMERIKRIS